MGCGGVSARTSFSSEDTGLDAQSPVAVSMRIELPFPPSVNHYWVRTARRVYLSEAAKRFSRLTAAAVAEVQRQYGHRSFLNVVRQQCH